MPILTIWVMVKVFIDESGSFVSLPDGTLCMVGALILPDQNYKFIEKLYLKLRSRLPKENGEVKGRHLDEEQINLVVDLLRRNQAILEINAVDLKIQSEHDLEKYRTRHLARQSESLHEFKGNAIAKVIASNQQIAETSLQLYLQALMVTHLLHRVVNTSTLYFSQRQPKELNNFSWIVDGKDKQRITKWETWLEWFSKGAISTMSKTKPFHS